MPTANPTQIQLRAAIRNMIEAHQSYHFLEHRGVWTCHTTLGYDLYEVGPTAEIAKKNLINFIVGSKHYSKYFIDNLYSKYGKSNV